MIKTSYCQRQPFKGRIAAAWTALTILDQVEIEDALQRWAPQGPEEAHIYARIDQRWQVLARKVPFAGRFLVAVHDLNNSEIVAVSIDQGPIRRVVPAAFNYLGRSSGATPRNPKWTG